jgi:hypothetical protein
VTQVSKVVRDMLMVNQFEGGAFVSFVWISIVVVLMNSERHLGELLIVVVL